MGMESHTSSVDEAKNDEEKKKGDIAEGIKMGKKTKKVCGVEDGLLLVVSTWIHGKAVRGLIVVYTHPRY